MRNLKASPQGMPDTLSLESAFLLDGDVHDVQLVHAYQEALSHLNKRGFVPFHPVLAERLGHKAALFIGLAVYWTRYSKERHRHGWFFMTAKQWSQFSGLTSREQVTVRSLLVDQGLIEEALAGRPAVMHFRINLKALGAFIGIKTTIVPSSEMASGWFRHCVSYYKPLADMAGNLAAGLYLSYLLQQQRNQAIEQNQLSKYLNISQEDVSIALCLGPKVQRNARSRLKQVGLIRESGPTLVHLNIQAVLSCLRGQDVRPLPEKKIGAKANPVQLNLVSATPTPRLPSKSLMPSIGGAQLPLDLMSSVSTARSRLTTPIPPTGTPLAGRRDMVLDIFAVATVSRLLPVAEVAENAKLGTVNFAENAKLEASDSAENAKLKLPKTHNHIQMVITKNTTTTRACDLGAATTAKTALPSRRRPAESNPVPQSQAAQVQQAQALDALVYPTGLAPSCIPGVRHVLHKAPAEGRQELLDELDGQLRIQGKTIHNPAGWLLGVIRQQMQGQVVLALASRVADERRHRLAIERQVQQAAQGQSASANEVGTAPAKPTASPEVIAAGRARLAQLRTEFVGKRRQT